MKTQHYERLLLPLLFGGALVLFGEGARGQRIAPGCGMEVSNIRRFGASERGDPGDNTRAIRKAIASKKPVYIPYGTFDFDETVTNPDLVPMFGPGTLRFTGSGGHAVVLGAADGTAHMAPSSQQTVLRVTRASIDLNSPFAGVALLNVYNLYARIWVESFDVGLLLEGNVRGCAYNTIELGRLKQNRVGVQLHALNDGYANQNTFIAGRFSVPISDLVDNHGVEFWAEDASHPIDGNLFLNPCFELSHHSNFVLSCFHGTGGGDVVATRNVVTGMRMEDPTATLVLLSGRGILDNEFRFTYGNAPATVIATLVRGDSPEDELTLVRNRFLGPPNLPLFKDEPRELGGWGRAQLEETPTALASPARGAFWARVQRRFYKEVAIGVLQADHVDISGADFPGMLFDLRNVASAHLRRIAVKAQLAGDGGRLAVVVFDAALQPIDADPTASSLPWWSGGYYRSGTDLDVSKTEYEVAFGNQVAYAFVGIAGGTSSAKLRELRYFGLGQADVRLALESDTLEDAGVGAALPVPVLDCDDPAATERPELPMSGNNYSMGTFVRNSAPEELLANSGSSYVVLGWIWSGTAWLECRADTGT